jgi:hypothetical protein
MVVSVLPVDDKIKGEAALAAGRGVKPTKKQKSNKKTAKT